MAVRGECVHADVLNSSTPPQTRLAWPSVPFRARIPSPFPPAQCSPSAWGWVTCSSRRTVVMRRQAMHARVPCSATWLHTGVLHLARWMRKSPDDYLLMPAKLGSRAAALAVDCFLRCYGNVKAKMDIKQTCISTSLLLTLKQQATPASLHSHRATARKSSAAKC